MSKTSRLAGSWVWVVARSPNGAVQSCSRLRFHSPVNPQYEGCDIGNVGDVHSIYVAFSKRILDRVELFCLLLKIMEQWVQSLSNIVVQPRILPHRHTNTWTCTIVSATAIIPTMLKPCHFPTPQPYSSLPRNIFPPQTDISIALQASLKLPSFDAQPLIRLSSIKGAQGTPNPWRYCSA